MRIYIYIYIYIYICVCVCVCEHLFIHFFIYFSSVSFVLVQQSWLYFMAYQPLWVIYWQISFIYIYMKTAECFSLRSLNEDVQVFQVFFLCLGQGDEESATYKLKHFRLCRWSLSGIVFDCCSELRWGLIFIWIVFYRIYFVHSVGKGGQVSYWRCLIW